jgi:hypothetical protein
MSGLLNELDSYREVNRAIATQGRSLVGMIYQQFLERFGIRLFPNSLPFSAREIREGWGWWDAQPFREEGYCRDKTSGEFFRFTMDKEMRGKLLTAIYLLGPSLGMEDVPTKKGDK